MKKSIFLAAFLLASFLASANNVNEVKVSESKIEETVQSASFLNNQEDNDDLVYCVTRTWYWATGETSTGPDGATYYEYIVSTSTTCYSF